MTVIATAVVLYGIYVIVPDRGVQGFNNQSAKAQGYIKRFLPQRAQRAQRGEG
ncbi:hypothetical protein QUB13_05660 [Microcoleus sp. B4-D4]